jgi:leukotriene-A4 hydrolase
MKHIFLGTLFLIGAFACQEKNEVESNAASKAIKIEKHGDCHHDLENHTHANIHEIHTVHLHLELIADFDLQKFTGVARHTMENSGVTTAIFDIDGVNIKKVTLGTTGNEIETPFKIGEHIENVGASLHVTILENTTDVNIYYETTAASHALDWLPPALTASGNHPFLYTQGQPILTRTWIPIQDTPANRITYSADIQVPVGLLAIMSASNPKAISSDGKYSFEMNQPIPSYLIALAIGEMEYHAFSENSGIYAEPAVIKAAAYEFADIPKMIDAAESIYGKYLWDEYDVVILPYSFPFGGMENPRLTFATPTLIAGDRSLVSVIAHELAHSWSGNLVTNASWNDIWLNEGFTVYFENRIMEKLFGQEIADMLFLVELQELEETIEKMIDEGMAEDTQLKLALECRNPDDGLTDIAYVKGAWFLKTLEQEVGRAAFDEFVSNYFASHKFQSLTSEEFLEYLEENLLAKLNITFNHEEWVYGTGIPSNAIAINSPRFDSVQELATNISNGGNIPAELRISDHITQEWIAFIRKFDRQLDHEKIKKIDEQIGFAQSGNAEIMTEWFLLNIASGYDGNFDALEKFLIKVGRRKFLKPLYSALALNEEYKKWALGVYEKARAGYHAVSFQTIDEILGWEVTEKG